MSEYTRRAKRLTADVVTEAFEDTLSLPDQQCRGYILKTNVA